MAELKRKEDQLTTAELAGRGEQKKTDRDLRGVKDAQRPKPVRSETADPRLRDSRGQVGGEAAPSRGSEEDLGSPALFSDSEIGELRARWSNIQTGFVDQPRSAVEEADKLVAAVMQRLAEGFANERTSLEKAWDRGDNVSTEDLRVALRRYRAFFDRLLSA